MRNIDKARMVKKGVDKAREFRKSSGPIAGVLGGIGDYTGIPPLLLRILIVVAIPLYWITIPSYLLLLIFLPKANKDHMLNYDQDDKQVVKQLKREISCGQCGEANRPDRNYCISCGGNLF